jgi:hypothetical protein
VIGVANYGLTFVVDAPYLLQEGVDVDDFPVIVKIPIANTTNLYGTGETADTIYFECEGEILKHELIEISATYCTAWVKMDLEADSKKVVTLHYGALVDNNYEDKRAVWVNGASVFHFNGDATDSMGILTATPTANVVYGTAYGTHYQGVYIPANHFFTLSPAMAITMPFTIITFQKTLGTATYNQFLGHSVDGVTDIQLGLAAVIKYGSGAAYAKAGADTTIRPENMVVFQKTVTGNNLIVYINSILQTCAYTGTLADTHTISFIGLNYRSSAWRYTLDRWISELWIFTDAKSSYWLNALYRMYRNPDAYIEYGTEVDLDALTALEIDEVDCVANVTKQLGIYDVDFRNIMYEVGDFNATWRLPGTEGITIWGIYQPRPVGDYYFPEMDNLGINDALFFTVTDYLVDIHDKIDIEGVRFDLQAIQVHPIADQKIYKMCVLKRQPEYYATCTGTVS